ncbi:MAG TPA: hypothetical protein VKE70_31115 [Candidatus Solibacter sp.]|nr:hypothetical protein [Candidatus Solibacter sp.]
MSIDWMLVATVAAPVLALFVGAALNRALERRVKLVSFLAHASAVNTALPNGTTLNVNTHSVVVRNAGKLPAHNVRLGHAFLPEAFSIYPPVHHQVEVVPGGGREIVIPLLVAGEQIIVAYLYFPPVTWQGVNRYTKCDEGFAKVVTVLATPQLPRWQQRSAWFLIVLGLVAAVYILVQFSLFVARHAAGP